MDLPGPSPSAAVRLACSMATTTREPAENVQEPQDARDHPGDGRSRRLYRPEPTGCRILREAATHIEAMPWCGADPLGEALERPDRRGEDYEVGTVTVEIPQEALALAGLDNQSDSEPASLLVALELFREERVSLGRAAELAGLGIEAFMDFAGKRQVPLHYAADDLAADRNTMARLSPDPSPTKEAMANPMLPQAQE